MLTCWWIDERLDSAHFELSAETFLSIVLTQGEHAVMLSTRSYEYTHVLVLAGAHVCTLAPHMLMACSKLKLNTTSAGALVNRCTQGVDVRK
jgi:hypothetical protein